jgi:L-lysine exporter family protein LysE/ArgO
MYLHSRDQAADNPAIPMNPATPSAFAQGWLMMAGLIVAIGAQNAFVLRQGLARSRVGLVVGLCAASDALLIALGVFGLGTSLAAAPALQELLRWGGALFLAGYALRAGLRAWRGTPQALVNVGGASAGLSTTVASTLALTYLNPHVYLDTVLLLGTVGAQQPGALRAAFAGGAALASAMWFATLGFGAAALSPWLQRAAVWRAVDATVAVVMAGVALQLVRH